MLVKCIAAKNTVYIYAVSTKNTVYIYAVHSTFNRFPVIQPVSLKVRHFSTYFAHFGLPGYAPGTTAVNVTWFEREFNAGQTPRSMYPSIFNHF